MTDALIGYDCEYWIKIGGTYVLMGEVYNVTPPDDTTDRIDATHMKSAGRRREYISGLIDPGEASFELNWIPGNDTDVRLRDLKASGENLDHKIVYPNGVACIYLAAVTNVSKAVPLDDKMTATVTVSVSGDETWEEADVPANTLLPSVAGVAQVGQVLTAVEGAWDRAKTYTYQWQQNGGSWANISGATARTYTPVVGSVGNPLRVIVTAANSEGSTSATSGATANVIAA